jgi:hypothetical protein
MPECAAMGEYRAPRSRANLRDYHWFCLAHVREYNATWDYYRGMTPGEIEAHVRSDTAWQRPTWPLGRLGGPHGLDEAALADRLDLLGVAARQHRRERPAAQAPAELREPLAELGLPWPVTLDAVKARYKELAKRHHPDANGGDRTSEERLKTINLAYAALRARLVAETSFAAAG